MRKRYAISTICLSVWWPCTGAFLPECTRKRYTIPAISFSLHGGLVPALFSQQPYEEEIRHFCESLSLCIVALYRRLSPCMEGGDTPFLRYLSLSVFNSLMTQPGRAYATKKNT
jgi:hypothetical protein